MEEKLGGSFRLSVYQGVGFLFISFLLFNLQGCSSHKETLIPPSGIEPFLYDDGDVVSLKRAAHHHNISMQQAVLKSPVEISAKLPQARDLTRSLQKFLDIIENYTQPFARDKALREHFNIFQARGRYNKPNGQMLVTGYYEPLLEGSLLKSAPYLYPLYSPPVDLHKAETQSGKTKIGRLDTEGSFRPYWTRAEIENTNVLEGNELVYLKDPFEAFLLHVQGSGKVKLQDGSIRSIQYRANNGHAYSSIGKLLVDENKLALKEVDIPSIRHYLTDNPQEMTRILHHNKRFVFFGWGDEENPLGTLGTPLTPQRSIAVDPSSLPMGAIGYLVSHKPVIDEDDQIVRWETMHRFVFPQDTGSAITGPGRVDFFWGNGKYAEIAAGAMKEKGRLYFLVNKENDDNL